MGSRHEGKGAMVAERNRCKCRYSPPDYWLRRGWQQSNRLSSGCLCKTSSVPWVVVSDMEVGGEVVLPYVEIIIVVGAGEEEALASFLLR